MSADDKKPGFGGRQGPVGHEGKSSNSEPGQTDRPAESEKRRDVSNKTSNKENPPRRVHRD